MSKTGRLPLLLFVAIAGFAISMILPLGARSDAGIYRFAFGFGFRLVRSKSRQRECDSE